MKLFSDTDFFARHQYLTVALVLICAATIDGIVRALEMFL